MEKKRKQVRPATSWWHCSKLDQSPEGTPPFWAAPSLALLPWRGAFWSTVAGTGSPAWRSPGWAGPQTWPPSSHRSHWAECCQGSPAGCPWSSPSHLCSDLQRGLWQRRIGLTRGNASADSWQGAEPSTAADHQEADTHTSEIWRFTLPLTLGGF